MKSLLSIPSLRGAEERFQINLSSRYRTETTPFQLLLISGCVVLVCGILWDIRQGFLIHQENQNIEAELNRVRQQDRALMEEAKREVLNQGLDGKVVFERYDNGGAADKVQMLASGSNPAP